MRALGAIWGDIDASGRALAGEAVATGWATDSRVEIHRELLAEEAGAIAALDAELSRVGGQTDPAIITVKASVLATRLELRF